MALKGAGQGREVYRFSSEEGGKMAKWFKEFPLALKNGTGKIRSVSASGSHPRANRAGLMISIGTKTGHRKNPSPDSAPGGGGVGKNRKNSGAEVSKTGIGSQKDGKVWDALLAGKSRKNSKAEAVLEEQHRPPKTSPPARAYISRMIRVDKQEKPPNFTVSGTAGGPVSSEAEKLAAQSTTETLIIVEDYADPFDAQKTRDQRDAERVGENDGYMEPYDAQQMITEIRRRGSKDLLKVCMSADGSEGPAKKGQPAAIYDDPYVGSGDGERTKPQLHQRPATEYELPWEWRKQHIIRTLSAQFDHPVKEETCFHTLTMQTQLQQQQNHLRQKSRSQKILRSSHPTLLPSTLPRSSPDGEARCLDPLLPLEKQSWYHGCVTRQEAEFQLQSCKEASFLVRNSESDNSKYSIALKTSQGCVHIIVAQTKENGFTLDQSSCVFPSIPEVVHHYCTSRLPFTGTEHMTLLHPVPRIH